MRFSTRLRRLGWMMACGGAVAAIPGGAMAAPDVVRAVVSAEKASGLDNARILGDYGSYAIVEVPDTQASRAAVTAAEGTLREDFQTIQLHREVIDTRDGDAKAATQRSGLGATRRLQLVQFPAPATDDQLLALESAGYSIVHAVPENAFIVWQRTATATMRLSSLAGDNNLLGWTGAYRSDHAISPALDKYADTPDALVPVTIQLYNYPVEGGARSARQVADDIVADAVKVLAEPDAAVDDHYINLRVVVRAQAIATIAALDPVVWIEPYLQRRLFDESQAQALAGNLNMAGSYPTTSGYLAWLSGKGFPTTAVSYPIVAIVDDGVDNGGGAPADQTLRDGGAPGGTSRLIFNLNKTIDASAGGIAGHGHINANIAVGLDPRVGVPAVTTEGFKRGTGISPYGRVGNVKVFRDSGSWWGGSDSTLGQDQWNNNVGVSSNSWGTDVGGSYDVDAQDYDKLARDAHSGIAGNQQMLFVFAAGNAGPTVNTMGSPATAKNILTVGGTEGFIAQGTADGCADSDANNFNDMASFSSRGPCDDSRVKPDVVAPSSHITGTTPPSFDGTGVCGGSGNIYFPSAQTIYTWSSGTSHSTPAVAGFASLVGNFLQREYGFGAIPLGVNPPSPALMKAYIIHATRYLSGGTGTGGNLPSNNQGYGAPNGDLAFSTAAPRFFRNQQDTLGTVGQSANFRGYIPNPAEPVRIVLAWTDAFGPVSGNAYVNNLDLLVGYSPKTYKGNVFSNNTSVTGGSHDVRNNVEAVFLPAGSLSGSTQINVNAFALNGDGVPGNADTTDQDFALVAYNFVQAQKQGRVFFRRPASGSTGNTVVDLFDSDLAASPTVSVALTSSNGDSESLLLAADPPGSGVFSGQIATTISVATASNGALETSCGGQVTVSYTDADPGPGGQAMTSDLLDVVCSGPAINSVNIANVTSTTARVTFTTSQSAIGRVIYGTGACGALSTTLEGPVATSHTFDLTSLVANSTYRFYVTAESDQSGLTSTNNNGGGCFSFVTPPAGRYFTEQFSASDNDLDNMTLTFTPNNTSDFYTVCRSAAVAFPTSVAGSTSVTPGDDGSTQVTLTGGKSVSLYGNNYSSLFINGNGFLTFGAVAVVDASETLPEHFSRVQVAALYDDLDPSAGGTVSYRQLADRFVVTFQNVPEWSQANQNSFQTEMFFDGTIRITWLAIAALDGIAGLSRGGGQPADFAEMNLNSVTACGGFLSGDVNGDGRVDTGDVTALHNYLNGIVAIVPPGDPDVDNNAVIDINDATMLTGYLVNQVPPALP